jgi:hypothetical protein
MKKYLILCCFLASTLGAFAGVIPLYPRASNPLKSGNWMPRAPQRPLMVEFDNYTLSFGYGFDEVVTVELLDEDEDVAYTDWLTPGQTSLVFPNSLSGEYNVRLTVGSVYYIGVIDL